MGHREEGPAVGGALGGKDYILLGYGGGKFVTPCEGRRKILRLYRSRMANSLTYNIYTHVRVRGDGSSVRKMQAFFIQKGRPRSLRAVPGRGRVVGTGVCNALRGETQDFASLQVGTLRLLGGFRGPISFGRVRPRQGEALQQAESTVYQRPLTSTKIWQNLL